MIEIVSFLSEETGLPESAISRIVSSAPRRYKVYTIPKRNGGEREIAQPAREVKALQRALLAGPLRNLKVHAAATAYRDGASILDNAQRHAGSGRAILKMDFSNFFPSITDLDWRKYCHANGVLDEEGITITSSLLFRQVGSSGRLRLAIGAPSSPALSNALMFEFDDEITRIVHEDKVIYTRYADDLTFSAPRAGHLRDVVKNVKRVLRALPYPKMRLNEDKTVLATTKYRRTVTGLTLANDGSVTIGRWRKRILSAMMHRAKNGLLSIEERQYLAGYLAFVAAIEPGFIVGLNARYGERVVSEIRRTVVLGSRVPLEIKNTMMRD